MKISPFLFSLLLCLSSCSVNNDAVFNELFDLTQKKNFFMAKEQYELNKSELSKPYQEYMEAVLYNAFNSLDKSDIIITRLMKKKDVLPDSLILRLCSVQYDNAFKSYNYKEAAAALNTAIDNYPELITDEKMDDYKNYLKICTPLINIPAQKVNILETSVIKIKRDKANLQNLPVRVENDSIDFIFDTGANISTTILSTAKKLNMQLFDTDIDVGTITGEKIKAKLGVCRKMTIKHVELYNVVFLVLPDESMSFPSIDYRILGILGYPVIEAFREITITQEDEFIVPLTESSFSGTSNMAMSELTPLIYIDGKHFTFDTGADNTILYELYYTENNAEIDSTYAPSEIRFGGAAGMRTIDGYIIRNSFNIGDKTADLDSVSVVTEKISDDETVYGNIGQDLIRKFDSMTINFDKMFIKFD